MPLGRLPHTSRTVTTLNLKDPCYRRIAKLVMLLEPVMSQQNPVWYQALLLPAPPYESLSRMKVM